MDDMNLAQLQAARGHRRGNPQPLPDDLPPVDTLTPTMLPEPLQGWLGDIAERMQIPLDYPAAAAAMTA